MTAISKSQADRAGSKLARASDPTDPELASASNVIDEWRALHGAPMLWVAASVQGRLTRVLRHVAVGQRLKRKPQIVSKLRREETRLVQMQDIGGCRAIADTSPDIVVAADRIKRSGPHYELVRQRDYRGDGRPDTGYRALHLVVLRDGRHVEVQLRTLRQQAWAEAVERAANRSGFNLKAGIGPPEVVECFKLFSDASHALDNGEQVSIKLRGKLRHLWPRVHEYLPAIDTRDRQPPAELRRQEFRTRLNNWLVVYDWRTARFVAWSDVGGDTASAVSQYSDFEKRDNYDDGYEVVLVGADSTDTLKRTHAHYFGENPNDLDPLKRFVKVLGSG